ncbi:MAG: GDP-mannose 4,6-dehydratase, partial [Sphaerospermopsis sp. SIO1G2]|nr:GDP-mannose 4,6-dehydratase [Sphaerospermopsis sp. SIO1G2]
QLGWQPQVSFTQLLENMVTTDLENLQSGKIAPIGQ